MITLFNIFITIIVYLLARVVAKKYATPLTSPVFLSTVIIICLLTVSDISYKQYLPAKTFMTYLLGPATVALALPIYKNRQLFVKYFSAAVAGILAGTISTITSAILLAIWFGFSEKFIRALTVKSVTVPVATEIGKIINGNIPLIVAFVIITGMIGAMFGSKLLSLCQISHPFARGLSIGTIAHGIGTAEAVKEGEIQGAVAGAAMGIAAVLTSLIIPLIVNFIS
jgi:putative effector of murein hydrolase